MSTGSRITLAALALAALIVTTAIVLDQSPEMTSDLLARIADGGAHGASGHEMHDTKDMSGKARP